MLNLWLTIIKRMRFIMRFISLILIVLLALPLVVLFITISQLINNRKMNKKVVNYWSRLLCFVCGVKLIVKGKIKQNPVLIVANHVTWLDIPVIHSFKLAGFVAKAEISKWPILGWAVKSGETLFIARGKHESRKKVLQAINKRLRQGRSIAVFPEGKATDGNQMAKFHRQLMHPAVENNIPIQAITIKYHKKDGSRNKSICFVNNEHFLKNVLRILSIPPCTAELVFCDVIDTTNRNAREVAQLAQKQVETELYKNDYM